MSNKLILLAAFVVSMLLMAFCFWMYSIAVALVRARSIMLERERHTDWAKALLTGDEK